MITILDEKRSVTYSLILSVWAMAALYALLHDQYIIRIEPRHFTVYHRPLWGIRNHTLLAGTYAILASIGKGFALGLACVLSARAGPWPRLSNKFIWIGVLTVIICTELVAASSGLWVYKTGSSFYPDLCFPEMTIGILITQTIQLTCYAAATVLSLTLVATMVLRRRRLAANAQYE